MIERKGFKKTDAEINKLVKNNSWILKTIVNEFDCKISERGQLLELALEYLKKAAIYYDSKKGEFPPYASTIIRNELIKKYKKNTLSNKIRKKLFTANFESTFNTLINMCEIQNVVIYLLFLLGEDVVVKFKDVTFSDVATIVNDMEKFQKNKTFTYEKKIVIMFLEDIIMLKISKNHFKTEENVDGDYLVCEFLKTEEEFKNILYFISTLEKIG